MGIFDELEQEELDELEEFENLFHAIDLNESNVNMIFERCKATAATENPKLVALYWKDAKPVTDYNLLFDMGIVEKNKKNILYLLGQLKAVHRDPNLDEFDLGAGIIKYDNSRWTTSQESLTQLCALGNLAERFTPILIDGTNYTVGVIPERMNPTLSPNDPNFAAWWAEHKAEWED